MSTHSQVPVIDLRILARARMAAKADAMPAQLKRKEVAA
jgi:hypothetical protein